MTEMTLAPPLAFSPDLETVGPGEDALNQAFVETFKSIVQTVFIDSAHAHRAVHAKSHALLRGMLAVHSDLPPELAQGVFRAPHRYGAIVRISSIAGDILNDNISLPRGFAIKLFGVEGDRLPGAGAADTQDFIFANGTAFPATDLHAFLGSLKVVAKTTDKAEWAKSALSAVLRPLARAEEKFGIATDALKGLGGYPETNPLGERYGSQAAYRFGDYVAKFDIVPASEAFLALEGREFALEGRENAIREEIGAVLAHEGGAWTLRAQLRRDAAANPVEDASVPWPEETNPYLPIATLTVKAQPAWTPERSSPASMTPWPSRPGAASSPTSLWGWSGGREGPSTPPCRPIVATSTGVRSASQASRRIWRTPNECAGRRRGDPARPGKPAKIGAGHGPSEGAGDTGRS